MNSGDITAWTCLAFVAGVFFLMIIMAVISSSENRTNLEICKLSGGTVLKVYYGDGWVCLPGERNE